MKKFSKIIYKISQVLDRAAGFCCFAMMVLVACNVVGRKVFNFPLTGTIELVQILFALTVGLALANCAVKGGHITLDFVADYFPEQIKKISPSKIIALSSHGNPSSFEKVSKILAAESNPAVLIGAFPKGPMSSDVLDMADEVYSVYPHSLESWTVTSRIIYEYEKHI